MLYYSNNSTLQITLYLQLSKDALLIVGEYWELKDEGTASWHLS